MTLRWIVTGCVGVAGAVVAIACGSSATPNPGGPVIPDAGVDSEVPDVGPVADAGAPVVDAAAEAAPSTCILDGGATGIPCSGACVNPAIDPANCGGCGLGCDAGALCQSGACENVVASLSGLRWELPCSTPSNGSTCQVDIDGGDEDILTTSISGVSGHTYQVTLHFHGVVEQRTYSGFDAGGALGFEADGGVNPGYFIAGGATPSTGDGYNIYELDISNPPQTYYLNSGSSGIEDVWFIDYLATIPVTAGATVTLTANAIDGQEISNQGPDAGPVLVPGLPPFPQAYDGQFVQMDIVSVVDSP